MTRLNLQQTCLLEVSGELGRKAKAQLREHIENYPRALIEYELVKGQFEMMQGLSRMDLEASDNKAIASGIKQGIHRKLRAQEHHAASRRRWQIAYRALAGVSGVAAALVITLSVTLVRQQEESERRAAVASAEQAMRDYLSADAANMTDYAYLVMASDIEQVEVQQAQLATSDEVIPVGAARLLEAIDTPMDDLRRAPEPGSI